MTDLRPMEELQTITDCVEEVLIVVRDASHKAQVALLTESQAERIGYDLYDRIEAILKRAQEIPRQAASGNPHRS